MRLEGEQPLPYGQECAEAGLLGDHRAAGRQVAGAAVAEPAAAGGHVAALGYAELGLGARDEAPIAGWRMRHPLRVEQAPAVGVQGREVPSLFGVDDERRSESLLR